MGTDKEFNGHLFDQLSIVERLDKAHDNGTYKEESEAIKREINRKLYQEPPITEK